MKEKELFDMVKNVDDDLICEMLEYSPEGAVEGDEYEGVLYLVPEKARKIHYWKYPVTAAALLLVMVGVLFVFNSGNALPYNKEEQTGGEQESTANTVNTEKSDFTEISDDAQPSVSDPLTPVVPDKIVKVGTVNVMYTSSYPEFSLPDISKATFTEMSTLELMEYYGMENMMKEIKEGSFIEVTDGNTAHGIYTYPDGNIYDINVFVFKTSYDSLEAGKKFTLTLGRETIFGREYSDERNEWGVTPKYYNEERETFFVIHELFGSCIMVSGKVDELTDYDDRELKETYYNYNYSDVNDEVWQGVPCELDLFLQDAMLCTLYFAQNEPDNMKQ